MSKTIERSYGAAKFYKPERQPTLTPVTAFPDSSSTDNVDSAWAWDTIIETVEGYHRLDNDWDGDQAVAPEPRLIGMAAELARQLKAVSNPAPCRVVAGVNGTICFEFSDDPFTMIEVVSPSKAEVYESGRLIKVIRTVLEA
jgi:hypothetical protein